MTIGLQLLSYEEMQQDLNKQLGDAVKRNDKREVTLLLDRGADMNYIAGEGYRVRETTIYLYCLYSQSSVVHVGRNRFDGRL